MITFSDLRRLFRYYDALRVLVYVVCWITFFLLLALLASVWPKGALWVTKLVEPLSGLLKDLFWAAIPEPGHLVRSGGRFLASFGRKALSITSDKTQLAVQLGVLNGFLVVSIAAMISACTVMSFVKRWLIRQLLAGQQQ
ncbi:MAG: hypothetical protein KA066_02830 [Candidatus Pacebacteria bacterium]|nr:hypothetical protein [Candidatus Paceibacterota bacterium]